MAAVCNIEENKELAQSIGEYIKASIKSSLSTNTPYKLVPDMKSVYDTLKDDNKVTALGVAAVVPQLFLGVLKLNPEYATQLLEQGFLMDPVYAFIQSIATAKDPIALTAKTLNVSDNPTISQMNSNLSGESLRSLVIPLSDSVTKVISKMLSTNTFLATSGNNRKSLNESNANLNFNYKVQEKLLKAQTGKDPTLEYVEYSGHTGFKLRLMLATNVPDAQKNIPGISLTEGNYVQVVVDNDGNYLYFNDDLQITTDPDKGKFVAFPQRNWNKADTKELFIESSMRSVTEAIKKETTDPAQVAIAITNAKKHFSDIIDKEIQSLNTHLTDINDNKVVLGNITGGTFGVITNPDDVKRTIDGKKLTADQKNELQKPLAEFDISKEAMKSLLTLLNKVIVDNYPTPIPIKGTLIAEKDPGLLDTLIDLLTEDLVQDGQPVPASKKKELFYQFTFPATIKVTHSNNNLSITVDGAPINLDDKENAKSILREAMSRKINGAYFSVMKPQAASNSYDQISISGNNLTTKRAAYLPFISQYVIPKVIYDKTTGKPMVINGFFTYELVKSDAQRNQDTTRIIGDGNDAIKGAGFNPKDINLGGFGLDRSKLLNSNANRIQKREAGKFEKTSFVLNARDPLTGKKLIPIDDKRLQNIVNSDAFATFSRAGITLYMGADSTHMYHEAWHAFSQLYFTYAQRTKLYKAVTTLNGSFTVLRKVGGPGVNNVESVTLNFKDLDVNKSQDRLYIEEFLAEEFRSYGINGGKFKVKNEKASKLEKFFKAVWETLKALFRFTLPANVYSNPGSQGILTEAFNTLYTATTESELNGYSYNIDNAEFGTLNSGAIYDVDGGVLLYPIETDLLKRSMDGIISTTINKLILEKKAFGAALEIFNNPNWLKYLYNNVIKDQFETRTEVLTKQLERLNEKVAEEKDELKKVVLESDALTIANQISTLSKALTNYGNIEGILTNKVADNSLIAYHLNNSEYKDVIQKAIRSKDDENDDSPNPLDILTKTGGVGPNEIDVSKLATTDAVYILSSLVKERYVNGQRIVELNDLGFPEPAEFDYFFNFLIQKISGQQSISRLYAKLVELKKLKINPLVDQLLDRMGNPDEVLNDTNATGMWFALAGALVPHRTDLVNTKFTTENGKTAVVTGKISAPYFSIKNEVWPSKFSVDTSIFIKVNKNNQNTIKLSEVYNKFLTREQNKEGDIFYTLSNKAKAIDFLTAIGIYLSDKSQSENRLREKTIDGGLTEIYNLIGHAYKNDVEISDIVKFLSKKNILQGETVIDGKATVKPMKFNSLVGTVNALAQVEADLGTEYANQMVFTSDGKIQSVLSQNSSFTRINYALNTASNSMEFGDMYSEFGYLPHLHPGNNPSAASSIVLNSLYDEHSKLKNEDNSYEINILSGAQHETINKSEEGIDRALSGVASKDMTGTDRFVRDISSMLQAGYMEGVANGDKNTFVSGKTKNLKTYPTKQSNHLFIDTEAFIIDKDGNWLTSVNPVLEIYNIMIPKLEAELKRIAMYEAGITDEQAARFGLKEGQGKDFYKKHVTGFDNAGKLDWFEDILESSQYPDIKKTLIENFLPLLSDTVTLKDLLSKDADFRKIVGTEIYNYFKAVADQTLKQDYNKVFGTALPDFLHQVITTNIKDKDILDNVSTEALINAAVLSFAVNGTLFTEEQMIIEYGNGYEFNHAEDEYSKRTSPYNSPGRIGFSDDIAIAMLNKHAPREYEAKRIKDGKINKKEVRGITRIGNKFIIQESVVKLPPEKYKSFHDLFKNTFIKRGITDGSRELDVLLYGERDGKVGTYEKPVGGAMGGWSGIKNADGQGWITFDFYRIIKKDEHNWSPRQEEAYQKEINGEHISSEDLLELFPVLKEGYAGSLAVGKGILAIQSIDKFSLLPLIPSFIKDTPWEIIQDKMMEQDGDYAMMPSSAKRSFIKSNALDANGEVANGDPIFMPGDSSELDPRFLSGEITFTKNPFFMEYLKNQTEVNKEFKEEGTLSTQYRKIFDIGLYNGGIPVDVNMSLEEWEELSEDEKEKESPVHTKVNRVFTLLDQLVKQMGIDLLDEMGWIKDGEDFKGSAEDLIAFLKKKLEAQGSYTEEDLAILNTPKSDEFPDVSAGTAAARLEKFLFSIVNKKMIRLKVTGEPLVQASNVGLQKLRSTLTPDEKALYTDKDLPSYSLNPDGSLAATNVKVAITDNYSNLYKTKYYSQNAEGKYVENGIIAVYKTVIDPKTGKPILNEKTKKPVKVLDDEASFNRLNEMIKIDAWKNSDRNREKIQISGLRIPGQSPNSTEFGEIWQFLPAAASNIIIIPAEIIAKAGSDFDVDKLSTYIKFISRQGTLLEATMSPSEIDKELKSVDEVIKQRKGDKLNINNSLDKFRKRIYKISRHINMTEAQIKSFTTRDNRRLLTTLADEKSLYFLKNNKNAKSAYMIYEKEIKGVSTTDYDGIADILETLYDTDSELFYYVKRKSDLMDYKNNYAQVIMNSLVDAIIAVQKSPEMAFSMLLPNGTYLVKPYADELKPIIQNIDNLPNFNLSIKTGKKIAGRSRGVSPTRAREYIYNKDKRQGNFDAKNSLSITALEIPLNGIFNKIGSTLEPTVFETVKVPDNKGVPELIDVDTAITIKLPHNYKVYTEAAKKIRQISISNILAVDKINQIADVLSQLTNGAVDAAKDNWIAYLQGNTEGITKILVMLEMGVPVGHIAYFVNNPLIREYIGIKRNAKSKLLKVYEAYNTDNYNTFKFKTYHAITPALNTPEGSKAIFAANSFWGLSVLLDAYMDNQGLDDSIFEEQALREVAYSSKTTADNSLRSKQIAGFLQYLYIEKLVEPFDTIKKGIDVDTNTNVDSQTIYSKMKMIETAENEAILGKKTLKAIKEKSMLAMFYPVLRFAKKLFGDTLLKFRTNTNLENFIYSAQLSRGYKIREATGYDEENLGNKFKNAISLHAFTAQLKQYKEGASGYKGTPISELFNDKSPVKSVEEVIKDYTNKNYAYDADNNNNFFNRGFYIIEPAAIAELTGNDFVELILEREFLRKKAMPFTQALSQSRHFQSIKNGIKNTELGQSLSEELLNKWAYEKLIINEALLNTFNYWQMFSSNDYSVADKFLIITNNYPELSPKLQSEKSRSYGDLLSRIIVDPLNDAAGNLLYKNLRVKAVKDITKGVSSQLTFLWKELANTGNIKKAVLLKNAEANKYISNFFEQLPTFMFLQSGLNSSKYSFSKIMPTENYRSIMSKALVNFEKESLTDSSQDRMALHGLLNLFVSINSLSARPKLNRGNNYKRTKNQLLELAKAPLNIYTLPYIRATDNKRVFLLDINYSEDGVKKKLTPAMIKTLRDAYGTEVVFLLNNFDLGIAGTDVMAIKNQIVLKTNAALASGKLIIINSEGFGQNISTTTTQSSTSVESKSSIVKNNWTKDSPKENPNTAYIFTENINSIGSSRVGGGSAVIRNNPNAIGIVTKKYYVYAEDRATSKITGGWNQDFQDTKEDFELFKKVNLEQFAKIDKYETKIFPQGFASDLAKIPTKFAEWLQNELLSRYGLVTELNANKTGLISKSITQPSTEDDNIDPELPDNIYDKLGNKTQSKNVILPKDVDPEADNIGMTYTTAIDFWRKIVPEAVALFGRSKEPLIVAFRGNSKKSFLENYNSGTHTIGNPFDWQVETGTREDQGIKSTKKFIHWMITGDNMGVVTATKEYRQAIINDIKSGKIKNSSILYYQEKGYATHATALDYLINDYDWPTQEDTDESDTCNTSPF